MSTTIDNRVVSMEFDNAKFEKNVEQSLDTLKNLDNTLNNMADNANRFNGISFDSLADRIDDLASNFSFLGTLTRKVFEEISEGIIDITQKIANISFSGLSNGWTKYGDKTSSVQQIMSATGRTIEDVNASLERLNWYTDETSYDFVAMTGNIAKFTSQNIGLEEAEAAMEGIANWAASAGQRAETASRAMYNISQSLGAGYMQAIDWRSIELANMATTKFKQVAIDTGLALGTLKKNAKGVAETVEGTEVTVSNFRESLKDKWFDTKVMSSVFQQYSSFNNLISEMTDKTGLTTSVLLRFAEAMSEGKTETAYLVKELGLSSETINKYKDYVSQLNDEQYALSREAFKMAQEATTFKDAIDAFNDAYSTAWMNVFEIIFGNYEKARKLWTDLANTLYEVFVEPVNSLIEILDKAFGGGSNKIKETIEGAGISLEKFTDIYKKLAHEKGWATAIPVDDIKTFDDVLENGNMTLEKYKRTLREIVVDGNNYPNGAKNATEAVEDLYQTVLKVRRGELGYGTERKKLLEEMGYDYDTIQDLVVSTRKGIAVTEEDLEKAVKNGVALTDEQQRSIMGIVDSADELAKEIDKIDNKTGFENFQEGLKNLMNICISFTSVIGEAFGDVFNSDDIVDSIYMLTYNFNQFTSDVLYSLNGSAGQAIKGFFVGLFSVFKELKGIVSKVASAFSPLGSIFKDIFGAAGEGTTGLLNFVASALKFISESKAFNTALTIINSGLKQIRVVIQFAIIAIKSLITKFKEMYSSLTGRVNVSLGNFKDILSKIPFVGGVLEFIEKLNKIIFDVAANCDSAEEAFEELKKRFKESKVVSAVTQIFSDLVDKLKEFQIVKDVIAWFDELFNGGLDENATTLDKLANAFTKVKDAISGFATALQTNYLNNIKVAFGKVKLESTAIDLNKFSEAFSGFGETLKKFAMTGDATSLFGDIKNRFDTLKKSTTPLIDSLNSVKESLDFSKIGMIGGFLGAIAAFSTLTKAIQAFSGLFKLRDAFAGLLNSVSSGINAMVNNVKYNAVIKVATAILILVGAIAVLCILSKSGYDVDGAVKNLLLVAGALAAIMIVMTIMSGIANKGKQGGASVVKGIMSLLSATAAIILLAGALFVLSKMDLGGLSVEKLLVLAGAVIVMLLITRLIKGVSKDSLRGAYALIAVAIAIAAAAGAIYLISKLDLSITEEAIKALLVVVGLMAVLALASKGIKFSNGLGLLSFVIAILVFEKALKKIIDNAIPLDVIKEHLWDLVAIIGIMAVFALISRIGGKNSWSAGIAIALMALSFLVVAKAIERLGSIDDRTLIKGAIVIAILSLIFGAVIYATKSLSGLNKSSVTALIAVIAGIAAILTAVLLLTMFGDMDKILGVTAAIVAIMLSLAGVMYTMGKIKINAKALVSLVVMSLVIVSLIAIMAKLSEMENPENLVKVAEGMAILLLALSASMLILSKQSEGTMNWKTVAMDLVMMVGMLILVAAALIAVSQHDIQNGVEIAIAMGILIVALGAAMFLANAAPSFNTSAGTNLLIASIALLPIAAALIAMDELIEHPEKLLSSVLAMGAMLLALSAVMVLLGAIPVDMGQVIGMLGIMTVFVLAMAAIIAGLSEWKTMLEAVDIEDMRRVGDILVETVSIIGEMIGAFLGSAFTGFAEGLVPMGKSIAQFGEDMKSFFNSMVEIGKNTDGIRAIEAMAEIIPAMLELKALQFIGIDFIEISDKFTSFGVCIANFSKSMDGIKYVNVTAASKALDSITQFVNAVPKTGGIVDFFVGTKDTKSFGEGIESIGNGVISFLKAMPEDFGEEDVKRVDIFVEIFNKIADASKNIENTGGLLGKIVGDNDLDDFATILNNSVDPITRFLRKLYTYESLFSAESQARVDNYVSVINKLVSCSHDIENSGGFLADVLGENTIDLFANQLNDAMLPIVRMLRKVKLYEVLFANGAPYLDDFIIVMDKIKGLPAKIREGIIGTDVKTIMIDIGEGFTELAEGLSSLKDQLINTRKIITNLDIIAEKIEKLSNTDFKFIEDSLKTALGLNEIDLTGKGDQLMYQLSIGLLRGGSYVLAAIRILINYMLKELNESYQSFYNSGMYVGLGFVRGIESMCASARQAAQNLASAAISGSTKQLHEASPSKVFYKIGSYVGEGFVNGINSQGRNVKTASEDMAGIAIESATTMANAIQAAIESESDMTITPVLDTSNIRKGLSDISGMLDARESYSIGARVASITKGIQNGSQNGELKVSLDDESLRALSAIKDTPITNNTTVSFEGSLARLGAVLYPVIKKEEIRIGNSMVNVGSSIGG